MDLYKEVASCNTMYDLATVVRNAPQDGIFLEFGVSMGSSLECIAKNTQQPIYGFDWWEGLPEDLCGEKDDGGYFIHDPVGSFKGEPAIPLPDHVRLVDGLFELSLPKWLNENTIGPISFVHIDCDLYSSTKTVFDNLKPYLKPGVILAFDEFMDYGTIDVWPHHEYKAFNEFLDDSTTLTCKCIGQRPPQVAFELISKKGSE